AVTSRGRVHGPMAQVLAIAAAHFPPGERLETPGVGDLDVTAVLHGVPAPRDDAAGALQAHLDLLAEAPEDEGWLLDAFALACSLGRRELAAELLERWRRVAEGGDAPLGAVLSAEILIRMLPAADAKPADGGDGGKGEVGPG
ncbi:MAG: hypothetical protein KDC98_07175, partial [Planctomycetes bacterium]|nr:hypothetical protein [Planctomycetota bacterium]